MQQFLNELPALLITIVVLAIFALVVLVEHLNVNDTLALAGVLAVPALSFWFMGKAYSWAPAQQQTPLQGGSSQQQDKAS